MFRMSKWIDGISPEQSATEAAQRSLSARLEVVWHDLSLAAESPEDSIEHVHQLLESSRRAVAALDVFREFLAPRHCRWLKRQLVATRQAAGDARRDDLLAARLAPAAEQDTAGTLTDLLGQAEAHRLRVQAPLVKAHRRAGRPRFERRIEKMIGRAGWRGQGAEPAFDCLAKCSMREAMAVFLEAAGGDLSAPDTLGRLRVDDQRLRYAMEIFASAFAPEFREQLYPCVEELQRRLDEVNEHATAEVRYERWLASARPGAEAAQLSKLILEEQAMLQRSLSALLAWWTPERADSFCHRLTAILQ